MGISPVTEEARGSSIGGKSVFQENGSGATPWLRWRCVPSPHPAGTTHPVNSLRESLFQHGNIGFTGNGAGLFGFRKLKKIGAINFMRAHSTPNCYFWRMKGLLEKFLRPFWKPISEILFIHHSMKINVTLITENNIFNINLSV